MYKIIFKRFFDLTLAILALPFLILIVITIGPIIYFQDKGPIFYNSSRLGKNGKIFKMYKLRSMKVNVPDLRNRDGSTFNAENDVRLSDIGKIIRKTSLDETPQILNVLKGDMSIIGPRPDLPGALLDYEGDEKKKLEVRPGLTGYNQAYFRNSVTQKQKFINDKYYVQNISLLFDLKIFIKTIFTVFNKNNVYVKEKKSKYFL